MSPMRNASPVRNTVPYALGNYGYGKTHPGAYQPTNIGYPGTR